MSSYNPLHQPNIYILAVIRSTDKCIVASYIRNDEIVLEGVRECIAGNSNIIRGKKYAVQGQSQSILYSLDPKGRCFCLVSAPKYPPGVAFAVLDELEEALNNELNEKFPTAKEGALSKPPMKLFNSIFEK